MERVSEPTPIASRQALPPSGLGNGVLSPLTLGLVSCGGIGALLFTGTYRWKAARDRPMTPGSNQLAL